MNWITLLTFLAIFLSCISTGLAVQNRKLRRHCERQVRNLSDKLNEESDCRAKLSAELTVHKSQIRELRRELKLHQVIDGEKLLFRELATHHVSTEEGERQERLSELIRIKREIEVKNHKLQLLAKEGGEEYEKLKGEVAGLEAHKEVVEESFKTLAEYAKRSRAGKAAADFMASKREGRLQNVPPKRPSEVG